MTKRTTKDKGKQAPKGKGQGAREGRAAPRDRAGKMAKPPQADEDLFGDKGVVTEEIKAERAERVAREEEEAHPEELAARALNPRQRAFAENYVKHANAAKAYRDAGYSETSDASVRACSSRLLAQANVRAYIGELLDECASPRIADARERLEFLTSVMRGQVRRKDTFYGETITVTAGVTDGLKAAELMAKIAGELKEKREHEGQVIVKVVRSNKAPSAIGERDGEDE